MIIVGQSELKDFRQCPLKHKFRWREGWHLPADHIDTSSSSSLGTLWHSVLQLHYGLIRDGWRDVTGINHQVALHVTALAETLDLEDEQVALLGWMYTGYVERWGLDPDWEIVEIEQRLVVPVVDPDAPDEEPEFGLRFTADLLVRLRSLGRLVIVDHKTTASQGVWTTGDVDLDDQLGIYTRGVARLDPDDPPLLAMLNQVRRDRLKRPMTLAERFRRLNSTRTRAELDEIERDALSDMRRMHGKENLRRPSSAPNPRQCGWSCDFKEAHIALRRSGGDWDEAVRILKARQFSDDPATDPADPANR